MFRQWLGRNRSDLRLIGGMAFPLMLTQLIQVMFQLADQAIVGRLGVEEFAAVGVASSFVFLITGTFGMLGGAFNIIGGKVLGKQDRDGFGRVFNVTMTLSLLIGLACEALILWQGENVLRLVYGLDGEILASATPYLHIGGLTIGINMILFNFSAYFKNIRKAHVLTYTLASASVVNVCMDYVLVFGKFGFPELGVRGAAWGSVIGYLVSILLSVLLFRKYRVFKFRLRLAIGTVRDLCRLYIPLALQDLVEYTLFAIALTAFVARLDVRLLAAHTVLTTLLELFMIPMYGFSGSCMTLSAQGYGKNGQDGFKYAAPSCFLLLIVLMPLGLAMLLLAAPLAGLITDKDDVIDVIVRLMPLVLGAGVINGVQMILRSALQAVDSERWVLSYSTFVYAAALAGLYVAVQHFALTGVYVGLGLCYLTLSVSYAAKLRLKRTGTRSPGLPVG